MPDVGYLAAWIGGVLALLSPCSALLLPSFFAYAFQDRRALVLRTLLFYLGLAAVLVPLGTGSALVSTLFYGHRQALVTVAGWVIIGFGLLQIVGGGFRSRRAAEAQQRLVDRGGRLSTLGLGAVYGLAGFCSGPILGSVLTVAAASGQPVYGSALLAVYALGMTTPLFLLAVLWDRFDLGRRRWLRGRSLRLGPARLHTTSLISGLLFMGIGWLFLAYDGTAGITGLLGDRTDAEFSLQQWAQDASAHVPPAALLLAVLLLLALIVVRHLRGRRTPPPTRDTIPDPRGDEPHPPAAGTEPEGSSTECHPASPHLSAP